MEKNDNDNDIGCLMIKLPIVVKQTILRKKKN